MACTLFAVVIGMFLARLLLLTLEIQLRINLPHFGLGSNTSLADVT
jgi:hypothetical protein